MMRFEDWFESGARPGSLDPEFDKRLAKAAWNAAIEKAADLVEQHYDECEPWLEPDQVRDLSA